MIFLSTGARPNMKGYEAAEEFYTSGIKHIELSGGVHDNEVFANLEALPVDAILQVHNYFPPPSSSFVLNLASSNEDIANRTISHIESVINLCSKSERIRPVYSFHAGFRLDPKVKELGNTISSNRLTDETEATNNFRQRLLKLSEHAASHGVSLLIENNVITRRNLESIGQNPLLLSEPDSIESFMAEMPENVRLLFDVAHFKVSSQTLGFDLVEGHKKVKKWIAGYHLSDNNGLEDSNCPVTDDSWFWKSIVPNLDNYTIEVYRQPVSVLKSQVKLVGQRLSKLRSSQSQ